MARSRATKEKAESIHQMFGVHEPPVDVHKIAEQLDFLVVPYDFPDETSAVLYIHEGVKSIGVNQRHAPVRQRFSIAHELGHYLSGHEDYTERGEGEKIQVDGRFDPSDPQQRLEQEANDFAAELLMPEAMVKEEMARMESFDATILARRFDVSEQALWIRLVGLGLAPE